MDPATKYRYEATVSYNLIGLWVNTPDYMGTLGDIFPYSPTLGDKIRIESDPTSDIIKVKLNGEDIIVANNSALQEGYPGLHAWNSETSTSSRAIDNFKAGGMGPGLSIHYVNNDNNRFISNQTNNIKGSFIGENITSVIITQEGATGVSIPFSHSEDLIVCTPIDMHEIDYIDGEGTIIVSSSTSSTSQTITFTAEPEFVSYTINSISSLGVLKNIPTAKAGDIVHITPAVGNSTATLDSDGALAVFDPTLPDDTYMAWWHWSQESKVWEKIDLTITTDYNLSTSKGPWRPVNSGDVKGVKFYF